jgi:hypothetical protein
MAAIILPSSKFVSQPWRQLEVSDHMEMGGRCEFVTGEWMLLIIIGLTRRSSDT